MTCEWLAADDALARERLVVVGDPGGSRILLDDLRKRYDDWSVVGCDSYLSAIAELSRRPARAVLASIRSDTSQAENAVAGLRMAAGAKAKLVLCCMPSAEPLARSAASAGADDYVIFPPVGEELDVVLGHPRAVKPPTALTPVPPVSLEELGLLSDVLSHLGDKPMRLVEKLAELLRVAMHARGVTVVVQGAAATAGESAMQPVLSAPIAGDKGVMGQVTVAARQSETYAPPDVERLKHYAALAGHLLQAAAKQRLWHRLSVTDECSGLPNRRYLHERMDAILSRAAEERFPVTILLFDVDDFKSYNDRYGHDAGDEIIAATGALFRKHCREQDVVTRYGGDEFAVVFWDPEGTRVAGSAHPGGALEVLDRFKSALQALKLSKIGSGGAGSLTISGGLATCPWDGTTREALLHHADQALLAAKRAGKNRVFLIGEAS